MLGMRKSQQDYFATFLADQYQVLILADGIGGLDHGDIASQVVVKAMKDYLCTRKLPDPERALKKGLEHANNVIAMIADEQLNSQAMGTTLVVLLIGGEYIHWLSVGDSSLYRVRSNSVARLNTPHTRFAQLQQQVLSGAISQLQADEDPQKSSIISAVTGDEIAIVDCKSELRWPEDAFLLSSDGLDLLSRSLLQAYLTDNQTAQLTADSLLAEVSALGDGAQDNCTVLLAYPAIKIPESVTGHE